MPVIMMTFLTLLKLEDQFQSHLEVGNQSPAQDTLSTGQWDSNFRMSAFNVPNGVVMVAGLTLPGIKEMFAVCQKSEYCHLSKNSIKFKDIASSV